MLSSEAKIRQRHRIQRSLFHQAAQPCRNCHKTDVCMSSYFAAATIAGIFKNSSSFSTRGVIRAISTAPLK